MQAICLKLFVSESHKHGGLLLMEWLLEWAKAMGVPGGSAFRAIAGYGRHGRLHEESFFELAGELPVQLEFVMSEAQARDFLALLEKEGLHLVYSRSTVEFGVVGGNP